MKKCLAIWNGFSTETPNQHKWYVKFYGREPLWKAPYSMGIVGKSRGRWWFLHCYECSSKNTGFKHTNYPYYELAVFSGILP